MNKRVRRLSEELKALGVMESSHLEGFYGNTIPGLMGLMGLYGNTEPGLKGLYGNTEPGLIDLPAKRANERLRGLAILESIHRLGENAKDRSLLDTAAALVSRSPGVDRPIVVDATWIARVLERRLLKEYPEAYFTWKTRRLAGGDRVSVTWQNGPDEEAVRAVVGMYEGTRLSGEKDRCWVSHWTPNPLLTFLATKKDPSISDVWTYAGGAFAPVVRKPGHSMMWAISGMAAVDLVRK